MHDNAAGFSDVELVSLRTAGCDPDGDHHHHHHHLQQQPMKSRRHPSVEQVTQLLDLTFSRNLFYMPMWSVTVLTLEFDYFYTLHGLPFQSRHRLILF